MRAVFGKSESVASRDTGQTVSTIPFRGTPDVPADQLARDWFVKLAKDLYPKDAGFALHLLTGFEERTCYRYASGDRKPPAFFLRSLLRTEQGWQVLAHTMDGCDVVWWRDVQRGRKYVNAIDQVEQGN